MFKYQQNFLPHDKIDHKLSIQRSIIVALEPEQGIIESDPAFSQFVSAPA